MIFFILYSVVFLAATVPGLPLGWRLFGRSHPAGWISGALIGYAVTCLAVWAGIQAGFPSGATFAGLWAVVSAGTWMSLRGEDQPLVALGPWQRRDFIAWAFVLALTTTIAAPPFLKLGSRDDAGNLYYRAYFTADFVWHTALTAEVARFSMPPRNPFMRHRAVHYYWTYFLLPAAVSETGPPPLRDVERSLKANAFLTGLLLVSAIFMSVRAAVPSALGAALAVSLALVASSAEGLWELGRVWQVGEPLDSLRFTNIDAVTAWRFNGYRVDGLQRAIWYNPQHSMAGALGLVGLTAAVAGSARSRRAGVMTGLALGGSVMMNPFVGAMFAVAYGVAAVVDNLRRGFTLRPILYSAAAAVPVVLALAWCQANEMVEGAGGAMQFGFSGISRHSPFTTLMLSLGPALVPAVAGLFFISGADVVAFVPAITMGAVSLFLMYFVRISVDDYWVGFRTGHLLLMSLPTLAGRFFASAWRVARPAAVAALAGILIAGAPTLIIDAYNAQDLTNREPSPAGFPWTQVVSPDEQAAFKWLRTATPPTAVVQQDVLSRHPASWWVVPTFGQRRMAAAMPPFLLNVPEYMELSLRVRELYSSLSAADAWAVGRSLRIDYVYVDAVERAAYGEKLAKFKDPRYFTPVFGNAAVEIYQLTDGQPRR